MTVERLASLAAPALRLALRHGDVNPRFTVDSDKPYYEQDGESLSWVLQEEMEIDLPLAEEVEKELLRQDPEDPREGDSPFFDPGQQIERNEASDWDFVEAWREFSECIKHRERFFGTDARDRLGDILGQPGSQEAAELPRHALTASDTIYRARRTRTADEARAFLALPLKLLGAPPFSSATPGRMNPTGIPVFYGSFSANTAIAEVRPDVGGIVAVAEWQPTRELLLLDLTRIGSYFTGSIFAEGYSRRASRARFLRSFHYLVTRPVLPHEEPIEHLPTQAVAEYIRNVLKFDGIIFQSVQYGSIDDEYGSTTAAEERAEMLSRCNVVVFPEPVTVERLAPFERDVSPQKFAGFPLSLVAESAHGVMVSRVTYESFRINLDDERGFTLEDEEF